MVCELAPIDVALLVQRAWHGSIEPHHIMEMHGLGSTMATLHLKMLADKLQKSHHLWGRKMSNRNVILLFISLNDATKMLQLLDNHPGLYEKSLKVIEMWRSGGAKHASDSFDEQDRKRIQHMDT